MYMNIFSYMCIQCVIELTMAKDLGKLFLKKSGGGFLKNHLK